MVTNIIKMINTKETYMTYYIRIRIVTSSIMKLNQKLSVKFVLMCCAIRYSKQICMSYASDLKPESGMMMIILLHRSYHRFSELLKVGIGTLAFLMVSCSPKENMEPKFGAPAEIPIRPAVIFNKLDSGTPNEPHFPEPYIKKGTGNFITTKAELSVSSGMKGKKNISLNFVDIEIRELLDKVLGEQLNLDYLIDPKINGRITVRTSNELPADDILSILDSVLNLNGAALVEDDGIYKVLPIDQVISSGITPEIRKVDDVGKFGFGVEIVPIKYIAADGLNELLQPIRSNDTTIQVNRQRNTALLVGPRSELRTLVSTIKIFDVDWMEGMSFGLFDLQHADSAKLSDELGRIFGGFDDVATGNTVRFIPIKRLNSIIVVAAQPSYLDRARSWVERLDKAAEGSDEQVYFYSVQNGRAADLARVLSSIFKIEQGVIQKKDSQTNDNRKLPGFDPIQFENTFDEENLPFDEYAPYVDNRSSYSGSEVSYSSTLVGEREARIVADESSNALLIRATPENFKKIQGAIRELDVQPVQVLLEATIAEVTLRDELSYGIQWFFQNGSGSVTLSELATGAVEQSFPGFSGIFSTNDKRVVFDALDSISDVRIVSSPQLLVLDNQTAQLEVGDEVPIVTQQAQDIDGSGDRLINTIEQRQTGVILNVTPRVNASGLVVLDIQQEVSDVVQTTTSGIDSPTISQRRIGTSIAVGNRQTVALGGLIRDRTSRFQQGIPLLSSIPVIGSLFGTTNDLTSRTELLVLITPNVVRNHLEAQAVTDELRRRFKAVAPLEEKLNRFNY